MTVMFMRMDTKRSSIYRLSTKGNEIQDNPISIERLKGLSEKKGEQEKRRYFFKILYCIVIVFHNI